jgi:cephalosporin-C deacetylase-like acetyl esterase
VVSFHGAGFKRANFRSDYGDNVIVFDVNAHGLNNQKPAAYYRQLNAEAPVDRDILSGRDNAAESYFKNMFLRTVRALEFIKSLPEWDGKTLIVHGRSQGGAQAIAAAALDKDVTLCVANVPALGDHAGVFAGRKPGWPEINPGKDPQIAAASDYVDVINLAGKVRCETILSIGMIDTICPPVSVYLIYKNIQSVKHITLYPAMGHNAPPTLLDGRERIKSEVTK